MMTLEGSSRRRPVRNGQLRLLVGGAGQRTSAREVATANTELPAPRGVDLTTFHDKEGDELGGWFRHSLLQPQRLVAMSSLLLPAVLGRPIAAVVHTTAALVALPERVAGLMTSAEQTIARIQGAVTRTDALLDRVEGVTGKADGVVHTASQTVTAAAVPVEQASTLTASATPLLERYSQLLRRLEPMVRRLAETTESHEADCPGDAHRPATAPDRCDGQRCDPAAGPPRPARPRLEPAAGQSLRPQPHD